jgi:hypothetical protein
VLLSELYHARIDAAIALGCCEVWGSCFFAEAQRNVFHCVDMLFLAKNEVSNCCFIQQSLPETDGESSVKRLPSAEQGLSHSRPRHESN